MTHVGPHLYVVLYMGNSKPFVQVACVCENALIEPDNVASVIRMVDVFNVNIPPGLPPGFTPSFAVTLMVGIKSGDVKGKGVISIQGRRPDGTPGGKIESPVELMGGGHGVTMKSQFVVLDPKHGMYWFDVSWNGELLTSIPADLKVTHTPTDAVGGAAQTTSQPAK